MRILVQKFGGTSVADIDRLKMVRGKVKAALDQGYKVVVVLSAKSGKTNKLLDLSTRWAAEPDLAEVDSLLSTGEQASIALFSMLLKDSGIKARSMLGWQIPIITNDEFGRARILSIDASRIHKELEAHDVLVVAGFQGSTEDGRITTLGRGGSDTSAVALAAALDSCECFDSNKTYVKKRLQTEQNEAVRKLLQADYDFLDEIQVEMSSARQFMFAVRFRREKDEQIFSTLNRVDKAISEHGFTARRMSKPEIKRMLALYFGTSISGEGIPDIGGEAEFNLEELHEN